MTDEVYLCDDCGFNYTFYGVNPLEWKAHGKCDECGKVANLYKVWRSNLHLKSLNKSKEIDPKPCLSCEYTACEQNSKTQHCDALKRWQDKQALSSKKETVKP